MPHCYIYIELVISLQWSSYHDICWPNVLSPFTWTVIHQRCYWLMLHWYLHTYLHCSNDVGDVIRNFGPHYISQRYILSSPWSCYFEQFFRFTAFWNIFRILLPWSWVVFRGYISSTTSRDFEVSYVRHIIELISYSGSFPVHISARGMFAWLVR